MADFVLRFTAGASVEPWLDPADGDSPSRINPKPGAPLKRYVATVGTEVEVSATVGGVEGPLDAALDGRLFVPFFCEGPNHPTFSADPGKSSVQRFTPTVAGHYLLRMRRPYGGVVLMPLDVVDP